LSSEVAAQPVDLDVVRPEVEAFCGGCHAVPPPQSFPKNAWYHEIERGYQFFLESGRTDLTAPRRANVVHYYHQQAPDQLRHSSPEQSQDTRFKQADLDWSSDTRTAVGAVSYICAVTDPGRPAAKLAYCDMKSGDVSWISFPGVGNTQSDASAPVQIAHSLKLQHPDHICQTDLDADGLPDYLISDLGTALAEDINRGRVVWLRPRGASELEQIVLLEGVGRVADAQPADFDGDGDLDIVVAVFGWHSTGSVLLLRQQAAEGGRPLFTPETLDARTGAIHVPVADLNSDGLPDFVVLFAQEHESVEAFLNQKDGSFAKQVIYRPLDPSFGSSGIDLVDFDGDADLDVLYTSGDTFDSFYVKPSHSVRWIENRGDGKWEARVLTSLPGAMRARAGDLDGDGDLDVAACTLVPPNVMLPEPELGPLSSLIWLERRGETFLRHEIERANSIHAALEVTDVNSDGLLDIVVGNSKQSGEARHPPLTVWWNQGGLNLAPAARSESPGD
jgi:hypothetical protein